MYFEAGKINRPSSIFGVFKYPRQYEQAKIILTTFIKLQKEQKAYLLFNN